MADRAGAATAPREVQNNGEAQQSTASRLFEQSGFMDKLKSGTKFVTEGTKDLVHQGLEKGRQIADDPTTKKITGKVVEGAKEVYHEKSGQALNTFEAGKNRDVQGVLKNGLPLAKDVLIGPEAAAAKLIKDKGFEAAMKAAPPEQRENLRRAKQAMDAAGKIANPDISGVAQSEIMKQASNPDTQRAVIEGTKDAVKKTGSFFRGLGEKMHIVEPREQTPQKKQN